MSTVTGERIQHFDEYEAWWAFFVRAMVFSAGLGIALSQSVYEDPWLVAVAIAMIVRALHRRPQHGW